MLSSIILGHLAPSTTTTTIPPLLAPALPTLRKIWADGTWRARASLLERLRLFSAMNSIDTWSMGMQAVAMISSLEVAKQTKLSYAKTLAAMSRRFGHECPLLDAFIAALRADGATIPMTQANPVTREDVLALCTRAFDQELPIHQALLYLMWKTASRYDDVTRLTRESVIFQEDNVAVIEWPATKSTRSDPFRVSGWTVIVEENIPVLLFDALDTISALPPNQRLTTMASGTFTRWLQAQPNRSHLTCHSFKRGSLGYLISAAAEGRLDPRLIPIMAKHKDQLHDFPVTTIRYAPNKVDVARMFGTQNATRLL